MTNILITGGAGFIGSNFIHYLMEETDLRVINLDLLTYAGNRDNCLEFEGSPRYRFIQGDIADKKTVETVIAEEKIELIVNFAAESHVDRSIYDASDFIKTNIAGTQVLLDVARKNKIARFLQVSTDEVYGDLTMDEPKFTENSPIKPSSTYAASKASADMLVLAAFRTHKQPVVITRCSNNYGPYQTPEKFIPHVFFKAENNESVPIYGTGTNVRDWIYVKDHCRGILMALTKGNEGEVYNLGGDSERKNIDVAKQILKHLGKSEDLLQFVVDRPGHDFRYAIDFTKSRGELGFSPQANFEEGIASTINWYSSNNVWIDQMTSTNNFKQFCNKHYNRSLTEKTDK